MSGDYVPAALRRHPQARHMPRRVVRYAAVRLARELSDVGLDRYDVGIAIEDRDATLIGACDRSGITETELMHDDAAVGRAVVGLANWIMGADR